MAFETKRISYSTAYSREISNNKEMFIDMYVPLPQNKNLITVVTLKTDAWLSHIFEKSKYIGIDKNQSYEILDDLQQLISSSRDSSSNLAQPIEALGVEAENSDHLQFSEVIEHANLSLTLRERWITPISHEVKLTQWVLVIFASLFSFVLVMLFETTLKRRRSERSLKLLQDKAESDARSVTLGEMSTAIAHELNQPLGAIHNYAIGCQSLLNKSGEKNEDLFKALEEIKAQALRGSLIIKSIREFVKRENTTSELIDLSEAINAIKPLIELQAKKANSSLSIRCAKPVHVLMNKALLEQVLLNITKNGFEAMQDTSQPNRQLEISVGTTGLELNAPSQWAFVSVSDLGCGVSEHIQNKLFKPFISTKDNGMGVGLNFCQSIVERQGGKIVWENKPTGGATFHLNLPIANLDGVT